MVEFSKIKRRLPPPTPAEAKANLRAPEVAPAPAKRRASKPLPRPAPAPPPEDGRAARATGRTHQLATRVRAEFHDELRLYAAQHRLKLVEVLERAFEALKANERKKPEK
jgi:hypothetical protein